MRRVLLLIKGLGKGGAEQLLVSAAPYLDRSRFDYEVAYLLPWKDALVAPLRATGLRVRCLDGARGLGWIGRLRTLVRQQRIDLVHVHSPYAAIGARLGLWGRYPRLVYTEHNLWGRYHVATYWANALTYPRNDHVFAVSEGVHGSIRYPRPLHALRMPPVETLYHGLDPADVARWGSADGVREELGIPEGRLIVGTVANFKAHKGLLDLLRAAVHVRRIIAEVTFVLVGHGPLETEIRRQARELGLEGTLVLAGYRPDAPRIASMFDVFALPSLQEGLSIALLEAMALGKPVVVTRVGGFPEVVEHGREGLIVPPGNPMALADAIVTILRDPSLRERMGWAARRRAARFDIRQTVSRIEAVYEELM